VAALGDPVIRHPVDLDPRVLRSVEPIDLPAKALRLESRTDGVRNAAGQEKDG